MRRKYSKIQITESPKQQQCVCVSILLSDSLCFENHQKVNLFSLFFLNLEQTRKKNSNWGNS